MPRSKRWLEQQGDLGGGKLSEQPKTSILGKIRTRHWIFGLGIPAQAIGMGITHPHAFDPQSLGMYISMIYGILDWHKNSGKN